MRCVTTILNAQRTSARHLDPLPMKMAAFTKPFTLAAVIATIVRWIFERLLPTPLMDAFTKHKIDFAMMEFVALWTPALQKTPIVQTVACLLKMIETAKITISAQTICAGQKDASSNQTLLCVMIMTNVPEPIRNQIAAEDPNAHQDALFIRHLPLPFTPKTTLRQEM